VTVFGDLRGTGEAFRALDEPPVGRPPVWPDGLFPRREGSNLAADANSEIDNSNQFNWKAFSLISTSVAVIIGFVLVLKTKEDDYG